MVFKNHIGQKIRCYWTWHRTSLINIGKSRRADVVSQTLHKHGKQGKRINECPKTACIYCDSMDKTGHIHSYTTKQNYESKFNICCQSSNLVYCLQCNTCGKQYVGQTKRKLLERLREHFNNIRKNHQNDTPLAVISTPLDTLVISNK